MKTNSEMLKRACCWVVPVQGLVVAFILATRDNSKALNALMPLLLLLMLINLPGWLLAVKLGLASGGGFNPSPDPHPVASDIVTFGVSTMLWVAVVWWFQSVLNQRCLKESEDRPRWPEGK